MAHLSQLGGPQRAADLRDLLTALVAAVVVRTVPRVQMDAVLSVLRVLLRQAA